VIADRSEVFTPAPYSSNIAMIYASEYLGFQCGYKERATRGKKDCDTPLPEKGSGLGHRDTRRGAPLPLIGTEASGRSDDAKVRDYNGRQPHTSLSLIPNEFAARSGQDHSQNGLSLGRRAFKGL
jgi:hypothetical protein